MRKPVVTRNLGYLEEFGTWSNSFSSNLELELKSLLKWSNQEISYEVNRRHKIAIENHDLSSWVEKLNSILIP